MTDHALPEAVRRGDLTLASELLRAGADPNARDPLGYPPLCVAAALGQPQMVEFLLDRGADPDVRARGGYTASELEPMVGDDDFTPYLELDAQGPWNGYTALHDACCTAMWRPRGCSSRPAHGSTSGAWTAAPRSTWLASTATRSWSICLLS
jgi:hypothetical protein